MYKIAFLIGFTLSLVIFASGQLNETGCQTFSQSLITFDRTILNLQLNGDHYIMYEDFKDTRISMSFQECATGFCNCGVYLKKKREIVFLDFCETRSPFSPTANSFFTVSLKPNSVGFDAINELLPCDIISPIDEDNLNIWNIIPTVVNGRFKCVRLQGANNFETYVFRTVEKRDTDSVKIKIIKTNRNIPNVIITPSKSSFNNSGGLCGFWDNNDKNELYILNKDGLKEFVNNNQSDLNVVKEFWTLNSKFNKVQEQNEDKFLTKRCPECFLLSERSFFCPCDEFDLFDIDNYQLNSSSRKQFCKIPMSICVEQALGFDGKTQRSIDSENNENLKSLTYEEAAKICTQGINDSPSLGPAISLGFFDPEKIIENCITELQASSNDSFSLDLILQVATDLTLQSMIIAGIDTNNQTILDILTSLCPNSCYERGICVVLLECVNLNTSIISPECFSPIKCKCNRPWGGRDCGMDLTHPPKIKLDRSCCDLRKTKCDLIYAYGQPFSTYDPIYAKIDYIEPLLDNSQNLISEITSLRANVFSNVRVKLNELDQLSLYKNIKGQTADRVLSQSSTTTYITISYFNDTFNDSSRVSFELYDSKCRNCSNDLTLLIPNKCEINGVCYNKDEYSTANSTLYCDPNIDGGINNWAQIDKRCDRRTHYWSEWLNLDTPDDDGDLELNMYKTRCANSIYLDVQTVDGLTLSQANQVVQLDKDCFGFMCLNREQREGETCYDYITRECCPIKNGK